MDERSLAQAGLRSFCVSERVESEAGEREIMEPNGALSNPQVPLELESLTERKAELLRRRGRTLPCSRLAPRTSSVASVVYKVIFEATAPMRAKDIHRACEDELGRSVSWSTVKACLSDHSRGARPRFERVAHGSMGRCPRASCRFKQRRAHTCPPLDRGPGVVSASRSCALERRGRGRGRRACRAG